MADTKIIALNNQMTEKNQMADTKIIALNNQMIENVIGQIKW
jgi:hypothetical protein